MVIKNNKNRSIIEGDEVKPLKNSSKATIQMRNESLYNMTIDRT